MVTEHEVGLVVAFSMTKSLDRPCELSAAVLMQLAKSIPLSAAVSMTAFCALPCAGELTGRLLPRC